MYLYQQARAVALITANISGAWKSAGLVPFDAQQAVDYAYPRLTIPSPLPAAVVELPSPLSTSRTSTGVQHLC